MSSLARTYSDLFNAPFLSDHESMVRAYRAHVGARRLRSENTDPAMCDYLLANEERTGQRLSAMVDTLRFSEHALWQLFWRYPPWERLHFDA